MRFLIVQSSDGAMFVSPEVKRAEDVYLLFGKQVLKMKGEIDTGNVDIDLIPLVEAPPGKIVKLKIT